jgi:hypothetical protein
MNEVKLIMEALFDAVADLALAVHAATLLTHRDY